MNRCSLYALTAVSMLAADHVTTATPAACLIEGEAFQFKGKWVVEKSSDCLGSAMLRVYQDSRNDPSTDALTVVTIPQEGTYQVWTRSQDFAESARPRTFTLSIDGAVMSPSGSHGYPGFRWEHVGEVNLSRKQVLMRLSDTGMYFGRCDAILLTTDPAADPNTMTNTEIARWRRNPVVMDYSTDEVPKLLPPHDITSGYTVAASASNDNIRISFVKLPDDGGIVCKTDFRAAGSWRRFSSTAEDNRIAVISNDVSAAPAINHNQYYPSWDICTASRTLSFEGQTYPVSVDGDNTNPYFTGTLTEARATAVTKTSADCIKVTYDCGEAGTMTGYWTVPESGSYIKLRLQFKPAADGNYSIALHGAKGVTEDKSAGVLMPPMFAGNRKPSTPLMMSSSMMSQCLAAVAAEESYGEATAFVCADLSTFPSDWGGYDYSQTGFALRNSRGELQPVAFAPVPGMSDSKVKQGKTLEVNFIVGITDGSWNDALAYISDNIFEVTDYRRPDGCSLTSTFTNIIKLIKDDANSGWESSLKGFWDIEADGNTSPTVVHASPLALLGASALLHDEELYEKRALPAIEYLLSRNGYRTRANAPAHLNPFKSQFPTTLYEGINTLTGNLNPWLAEIALPEGETRWSNGYFSTLQQFRQELAAYRLTGDETRFDRACSLATVFAGEVMSDNLPEMAYGSFYNSQMILDWTPLLDIYRATGDQLYLDAAAHGAAHTVAGVKTWPKVAEGDITVHPGDSYDGVTTIWWKGPQQYRLGFPRKPGDAPEHEVEAWKVSPVGLGMEQPATYFLRSAGKTVRPVFMNSWAPRLMELGELSGKTIFSTYGRNAVIGRGENYPGYYATGYTDITSSRDFPYTGPDVSSIYYHHIPAYLAMIQDYLISGIIARSDSDVSFEPARQEGFVWFNNNIYGGQQGKVRGEDAQLYMPDGGVTVDNPAVSFICARSDSKFHLILSNDSDADVKANIKLSERISLQLIDSQDSQLSAELPSRGIKILTLDAEFPDYPAVQPQLTDGMTVIPTGTDAGDIYLFRIRSPFGWDSVYGFAGCSQTDGLTITAECDGTTTETSSWPYEWSFARFGYDEPADVRITLRKGSTTLKTLTHTFAGSSSAVEDIFPDTPVCPKMKGIFTPDGRKVSKITSPGIYIVDGKKVIFHEGSVPSIGS